MRKNFTKKLMLVLFAVLSIGHLSAQNGYDMTLKRPPNSTTEQTQVEQSLPTFPGSAKGKIAYANIIYPSVSQGYKSFDVDNITGATTITPLLDDLYGGDYYNGIFYTHSYDGTFYKINAATGVAIETIPGAWSSYMSDMAYDHVADIMYAVKNLQLYTIDLTTGVPTEVATLTGAANNMLTLAIDATGNMYGITISSGNLYSINKTTGACTLIGNTGRTPSYAQCMGFDHESGTLYWCSSTAYTDDFGTVNVSTGAYTMIQANCYEITGFHIPYSAGGELPPVEAGEAVATIQGANVHLAWEPETTTGLTGFEIYRKDCYATDWEGAELIAGNIPAAQTEFMDYSWAAADYGVYNWGVFAYYESGPTAIYSSNCLDKDMLIEVDVTVTLNSGENATGTVVTFTNTSEPDLELVYEATLPSSGKFTWDEFRKGTYDISVVKDGYTGVDETGYEIYDDESFNWLLTELLLPPSNLYVTPTAYASWQGGVTNEDVVVTIGEGTSGTYEIPINTFYRYTYSQQIFDASEIGHSSGKISSVAFQYIYGTSQTRQDFTVYMANTDKSEFASTTDWIPLNQLQEVFSGSINLNNSGTDFWYTIEFDTEFEYTGGNVVLVVLDNEGSYYTSSNYTFYRHVASGYKTLHYRVDGTVPINPASPPTAYSRTKNRNNVQFGMNVPVRAAELSKVYLDGTFVANTTNQFYQYDPATLTVGETYLSEVLIGYTSGNSARSSYEFTYLGCAAYNAPTALTSVQTVGTKDAVLTWTNPTLTNVDYLRVYRDGELYKDNLSMDTPFTTWTDTDIANGTYNYALTLVYDDGAETCITAATTSITIKSTGTINGTVTYQLGGNVNGATITVSNTSNTYTFTTNASGAYTGAVEAGTYTVKCEFAGHETQTTSAEIVYVGTSNVNFSLFETPVGVDNVEAWVENGAVTISWDGSGPTPPGGNIFDDVEGHTAFTINSPGTVGWSYIDGDGLTTYEFADCDFPGEMEAMAYIVFDPNATSPAVTGGYVSYSGTKYFGCLASYGGANNDWIISPQLNNPSHISFYGKSITVSYGMERFKVGYSTTGMAQADFTFVTPSPYVQVPAEWTLYEYDIPANAKYVAINCVSNDAFMFMVDDITITQGSGKLTFTPSPTVDVPIIARNSHEGKMVKIAPNGQTQPITPQQEPIADKGTRALTGYSVYRTDCYEGELELLGTVPSTTGTFIDNQWSSLDFGVYKWGVKAIYDLNASEVAYSNCLDKDMITEVSVKVNLNTAESPVDTKVTLVNISEPDMELVYEVKLDETGYFLFEEFRKGEYDITVFKFGYELLELTEEVSEATDFVWLLEELIDPPLDLYVSPTGYATWTVPAAPEFEGFYESFDEGIPATWSIDGVGWKVAVPSHQLNGTPCVEADSDAHGSGLNTILTSPVIDVSMCEELYLSFIQYYRFLLSPEFGKVEVYDGGQWVTVLNQTATSGSQTSPNAREIDVTEYINEDFQVRFHYNAPGWYWYWILDDVMLSDKPAKDRAIQYYKVWLDGVFEADTPDQFYQHDVTNLVEDQEYTTEVAIFYTSGLSDKIEYTWTYKPCEYYGGALTFEAEVTGNQEVTLNWTLPGGTTPPPPPEDIARIELVANNVWGDGSGYIMMLDADANMYPEFPAGNFGGTMSAAFFNEFEYTIPEGATTAISSPVVATGSAYIDIPAGTYDYIIVNPESASGIVWVAGSAGPASTTGDNYSFEAGKKYTYTMSMFGSNDGATLVITDISKATTNLQPVKPIIASTGEKSYSYGSEIRTTENVSVIDGSKLQSEISPSFGSNGVASRAQWDLVKEFNLNAGGEQGIATDGEYIYTAFWGTAGKFSKYEMDGTYIEDFTISGGGATRDITYDGEYFYGSAGSTTIYKYDFANKTLIGTISSAKTARHISYDPETGGFYVGDWSDLSLISSTGSLVSTCPAPSSAYGSAYYAPSDGSGPYLFLNTQDGGYGTSNVYTYDISSNTMSTTYVNVAASMTGIDMGAAIAGGAFIADYDGKLCFFANIQQTPNKVGIFELEEGIIIPPPPVEEIIGVNLYRDGEFIAFVPEDVNEYVDEGVYYGDHEYCIRVVYISLAMSCEGQCETVPIPYPCDPTGNLEGVNPQDTQNALISWGAEPIEEWLKYDDGINVDGIGGPSTFIWAVKFDPNQLSHLDGTSLTKISIYKYAAGTDELRIYQGNNAATLLHSQQLDGLVVSMYQDVELSSPVALDVTQQLWIAVSTTNGTTYPAGCGNYAGNPNSDLISQDGGATWEHINDMGLPYSWNLRGYVTNVRGVEMAIPMEKPIDPISTESFVARGKGHYNEAPVIVTRSNDALQGYNVYRKLSTESTYTVVGNVPAVSGQMTYEFLDADLTPGKYHFQVTALYEFEDGYECESEPALTPDGSQNFVEVIIETGIDSYGAEARIYPNPASNYITIEAANMNRITVMSMVGQVVYDVKVDSNQESVDVSSLKSGVYVVRISTESGVSTERITIVR